jgi:hypothetical protein
MPCLRLSHICLASSGRLFGDVLPWLIVLLAVVVVGAVVVVAARRLLRSDDWGGGGFTLHDLRQMHARGELSDEEYARARAQMVGRLRPPPDQEQFDAADSSSTTGNTPDSPT